MIFLGSPGTIRSNLSWIVLGALVPMLLLGALQAVLTYRDSRDLVADRMRARAWEIAESERDPFIIARHSLIMAARHPDVLGMTPGCNAVLDSMRNGATGLVNFLRTDRTGRVRCSGMLYDPGQTLAYRQWWQSAKTRRTIVIGEPQVGEVSKRRVIIMGVAVADPATGEFDGTVSAGISIDRLKASLASKRGEFSGDILVVDAQGRVLVAPQPVQLARVPNVQAARDATQSVRTRNGEDLIYVAAPLFSQDMYIVYLEPESSFSNTALSRMWMILALPLLAMLLAIMAVWFGTQRLLLDWFPRLHNLTGGFAHGNFAGDRDGFANAPREISGLADHLHAMAESFDEHETQLRVALAERTALMRELNHRVRNNLQIIASLLTIQAEQAQNGRTRAMLDQARARISALGLLHRVVYEETGAGEGLVAMPRLLSELCAQLGSTHRSQSEITLECKSQNAVLTMDQAVPLTLFAVEAISNAYRHAFAEGDAGKIELEFTCEDKIACLRVCDNGHGMDEAGAMPQMGMELLHAVAGQLGGAVEIRPAETGVCITLEFSLADDETNAS